MIFFHSLFSPFTVCCTRMNSLEYTVIWKGYGEVVTIPNNNAQIYPYNCISYEQMNIINQFRQLSMDFVTWDRALVHAIKFNTPNYTATFERLYNVPYQIYSIMSTFYGKAIAERYMTILNQMSLAYINLVTAINAGDAGKADEALKQLYGLGEVHAAFYAQLSPYWSLDQWQYMMYQYISSVYNGAIAILSGDYKAGIEIYDRAAEIAALMAEYSARGIMLNLATPPSIPSVSS